MSQNMAVFAQTCAWVKALRRRAFHSTWNIRWAVLVACVSNAQLANPVAAPALDPAPGRDDARMPFPQGDSNGFAA